MGRDENWSFFFLHWFSRIGPCEWMGHGRVVICHEHFELRFKVGNRRKVSTPQELSVNDTKDDVSDRTPRASRRDL